MQRILHISKYYYPFAGGIEQTARDCVTALSKECRQKVICFNHEKGSAVDIVDGVEIIRCACQLKAASQPISIEYGKKLRQVLDSFQPDLILFHYPNPYVSHFLLKCFPKQSRMILYWHLDITRQKLLGKIFHIQSKKMIETAYKIIATSPNYIEGSRYLSWAKEKCTVIPSCINEKRLELNESICRMSKNIRDLNKGKTICLAVGRHVPYKGFAYLIRAGRLLDNSFTVYIAGKGEMTSYLQKLAEGDEKIHFIGAVSDDQLKAYYLASDIFCFPSVTKNEAFGLALAEAMYFSKPSVTFTIQGSGVNYVSQDHVTGLEVRNGDISAYAEALISLKEDAAVRSIYGENARKRVEELFLYDTFRGKLEQLINQC